MELKEKLISARKRKGLTQLQLAQKVEAAQATINKLESGKIVNPSFELAVKIANALESDVFDIFGSETVGNYYPTFKENDRDNFKILVFMAIEEYVSMQILIKSGYFNEENKEDQKQFEEFKFNLHSFKAGMYASLVAKGFCTAKEISIFRDHIKPNKKSDSK